MSERAARVAQLVLRNGRIHASVRPVADATAIAFGGDRVIAVGDDSEIEALVGPDTDVRDLRGGAVLPGLIDSHTHFHRTAMVRRFSLDFERLRPRALADVAAHVRARAATLPPDAWIQGDSLSASRLAERRWPDRTLLDEAGGGRPVVLRGIGKHVIAASSAALAIAGIEAATADPPGGRIEREPDGRPSGVLHERAKLRLDAADPATVLPVPSRAERLAALRAEIGELHRLGITTIHEMIRLPEEVDDIAALHAAGDLPVRVRLYYRVHETVIRLDDLERLGIRSGLGDDRLRIAGVKISVDGWCIFRNAAVERPYLCEPDQRGLLRIEPAELTELTRRANAHGLAIALHAVGPRAVDAALDAFEAAGPASVPPYRLEHGHLDLDRARLERMRALDVAWSVQPALLSAYRDDWAAILEPERVAAIMPLGIADELAIPTLHNSDVPSGPQEPFVAIRDATARPGVGSTSVERAWLGWTSTAAWAARDGALGHLRPGARADAIVVAGEPFAAGPEGWRAPRLQMTIGAGRIVHFADGEPPPILGDDPPGEVAGRAILGRTQREQSGWP
ncbi:MAG TPA: amidohydrolase family protein [Candidatus Limnocylindrales bacterium]|nr:amidohydrolase family protein [Candidatus Limnocylindrales bacterium]